MLPPCSAFEKAFVEMSAHCSFALAYLMVFSWFWKVPYDQRKSRHVRSRYVAQWRQSPSWSCQIASFTCCWPCCWSLASLCDRPVALLPMESPPAPGVEPPDNGLRMATMYPDNPTLTTTPREVHIPLVSLLLQRSCRSPPSVLSFW